MELSDHEYTVAQKHEGKWKMLRILMILGYVLFAGLYFLGAYLSRFIPIVAILPLFLWILVYFTFRYVNPEYKYTITAGHLHFYKIFGKKSREVIKIKLCDALYIMPLEDALDKIKEVDPKKTYSALPSIHSTDSYIILYKDEEGTPSAFMFKVTSDGLKSLRFYNKNTVMSQTEV